MITAADVLNTRFTSTQFRGGYDERTVDDFLDRVIETLRGLEGGRPVPGGVTADEVRGAALIPVSMRRGYDTAEVDQLLDQVALALDVHEGRATRESIQSGRLVGGQNTAPRAPVAPHSGAVSSPQREGLVARLLRAFRGDPPPR